MPLPGSQHRPGRQRRSRTGRDLRPRWHERVRQLIADRRRGGRLPRTLRRLAACALIIAAGVIALWPADASDGAQVVAFSRDLAVGSQLQDTDVHLIRTREVPDGAILDPASLVGRVLVGDARRGEVITDVRLTDPLGPDPGPGRVAVPVRPADPAITGLLDTGMHVAVIAVAEDGSSAALAADAVVLAIAPAAERGSDDRPIVLAVPAEVADQVVAAALAGTIALRFT
ncbi:MAG: SAF domain-containing protein [Nakamurella sp.]